MNGKWLYECLRYKTIVGYRCYSSRCLLIDVRQRARNDAPIRVSGKQCDRICISLTIAHPRLISSALLGPSSDCEGLAASGLPVSKNRAVVSRQNAVDLIHVQVHFMSEVLYQLKTATRREHFVINAQSCGITDHILCYHGKNVVLSAVHVKDCIVIRVTI